MKGLVTFKNVSHVATPCEVVQQRNALRRSQAQARINRGVDALLYGFSGPYLDDLVNALIAKTADVAAEHKDGAFACAMLGKHAGRVGGIAAPDRFAVAHQAFRAAPDVLAEVE
jgi:hypothetical protein